MVQGFTPPALQLLLAYAWPGNVRELANVVERAVILTTRPLLTPALFLLEDRPESPAPVAVAQPSSSAHQPEAGRPPRAVLETLEQARATCERAYLVDVLTATQGTVSRAAVLSGMHRGPFYKLLRKYALDPAAFRNGTSPM